jgi:hypothetical protein
MAFYYDEDYHNNNDWWEEDETEEEYYSNEEEDYESSDSEEQTTQIDESIVDDRIIYTAWRMIKLGDVTLRVSNTGKVQYTDVSMFMITKGLREEGTPYRFVHVETSNGDMQKFYVHDLIWRAFNEEDPIAGWEVRHLNETPMDDENCYLNELRYLDLFEDKVCKHYKIQNII